MLQMAENLFGFYRWPVTEREKEGILFSSSGKETDLHEKQDWHSLCSPRESGPCTERLAGEEEDSAVPDLHQIAAGAPGVAV